MMRTLQRAAFSSLPVSAARTFNIYQTTTSDPFFNLAFEEYLLRGHPRDACSLFLWRNKPSVIIGRNQNPWKECHISRLEQEGVELVRRKSGGGAVYQDLGNSIYTFISPDAAERKKQHNHILIDALATFGVKGSSSGRNDIHVDGKKVSGAAFKIEKGNLLHHGTMLLNLDLGALGRLLNPNKAKMQSKGITSVVARVCNLCDIVPGLTHDAWCDALADSFRRFHGISTDTSVQHVNHEAMHSLPELKQTYEELRDWDWRFGRSPEFTHSFEKHFPFGLFEA